MNKQGVLRIHVCEKFNAIWTNRFDVVFLQKIYQMYQLTLPGGLVDTPIHLSHNLYLEDGNKFIIIDNKES
jgi:hypothetical protein